MNFENFKNFMTKLSQLSGNEMPTYLIVKDLFDFIDIRKDGVLDLAEWM